MEHQPLPPAISRRRFLTYSAAAATTLVFAKNLPTAHAAAVVDVVVDNPQAELLPAGSWPTSSYANGFYGTNYANSAWSSSSTAVARWTPELPSPGEYVVQLWLPDGDRNRSTAAVYRVHHAGQVTTLELDQTIGGGYWRGSTGPLTFAADGSEYVELVVADARPPVVHVNADAARFVEPYVPAVPADVAATWVVGGGIEVAWEIAAEADYYVVRRSITPTGPLEVVAGLVLGGSYLDEDTGTGDFTYTVAAAGPGGEGAQSARVDVQRPAPPGEAPGTPVATAGNQQVTLTWQPVERASHYVVRRHESGGTSVVVADRVVRTTFTVVRLENGVDAHFTVTAANAGGEGPATNPLVARPAGPPLLTPHGLVATAAAGAVHLAWHPTDDAETYQVQRAVGVGRRALAFTTVAETTEPSYIDRDVEPGFVHHYVVRAAGPDGAAVRASYQASAVPGTSIELVIDHADAEFTGEWTASAIMPGYRGHDAMVAQPGADAVATFTPAPGTSGEFSVWVWFPHGAADAASSAPFTVAHAGGEDTITVDQRGAGCHWVRLGDGLFTIDASAGHHVRLASSAGGYVVADAVRLLPAAETSAAGYRVDWTDPQQLIEGIGVEILYDCLQPGGQLACTIERVPQSLTDSERQRWYDEMLTGFRHIRLAMGLYLRGTDDEGRQILDAYPGQIDDIAESAQRSGATVTPTYWSPPPYFKSTGSLLGGQLAADDPSFLGDLADAMSADIDTLKARGVPVGAWSLQNEPQNRPPNQSAGPYSMCYYAPPDYVTTFNAVAPRIRSDHPELHIFGPDSGHSHTWIDEITPDAEASSLMESWSWHNGGISHHPEALIEPGGTWRNLGDRPLVNTEYSYSGDDGADFVNTAKNILFHFLYYGSPTWYWLHALQPTNSNFGETRALGVWRPETDDSVGGEYGHLEVGHWDYVGINWHPIAGFVKLMPHDAVRYSVLGDVAADPDHKVMAFEAPDGSRGVVVLNGAAEPAEISIDVGAPDRLVGHGFSREQRFTDLGTASGPTLTCALAPESLQFWVTARPAHRRRNS
ncbi:fibronectin type III domain-containing protein [Jiangella muralis]|uniref:golvesin C-terminal-like domain-containing protein n=1 Tax=Jiangella muralis TaxID=702383 RepID=UPI00069CCBCE|nr:hypothetical protein [Jiangella muralis]